MSEFIRHLNGSGWAPLSRKAMDDTRLTISARGVLAWLCSRPDDHQVVLTYALTRWNISKPTWARIRTELELTGYLTVKRVQERGRFRWIYELTDTPSTDAAVQKKTIGKKTADSKTVGNQHGGIHDTSGPDTSVPAPIDHAPPARGAPPRSHAASPRASKAGVILSPENEKKFQQVLAASASFVEWLETQEPSSWQLKKQKDVLRRCFSRGEDILAVIDAAVSNGYRTFEYAGRTK